MQSARELRKFCSELPIVFHYCFENDSLLEVLAGDLPSENVRFERYSKIDFPDAPQREGHRNSNIQRVKALLESPFDNTVYLDNDVYVVHRGFSEGFKIVNKFGLALPMNPRWYVSTKEGDSGDLDIGADVSEYDRSKIKEMRSTCLR